MRAKNSLLSDFGITDVAYLLRKLNVTAVDLRADAHYGPNILSLLEPQERWYLSQNGLV